MVHISIVTPVYKAESYILALYKAIVREVEKITLNFEIVMVEDCGGDGSWALIEAIAKDDTRVKAIKLNRNWGQHHAISAGIHTCCGDWVVVMDCDLQDRPEEIIRLYDKAQEGYEMVCARRGERKDTLWKRFTSRCFIAVFNAFSGLNYDGEIANFRIISGKVVEAYKNMGEATRNFAAQLQWLGFESAYIDVEHGERHSGKSSYSSIKLIKLAVDSIVAYSDKPLRISIRVGLCISLFSFILALYFIQRKIVWGIPIDGWASLMVSIWFIGGAIIGNLGIVGLYMGKIYGETKCRPLYIIARSINFP